MALARDKAFAQIDRLLAQGKSREAAQAIRELTGESPHDASILNRVGDLLVKHRRTGEAIALFERAADELAAAGFFPKAIAVCRKVLRLEPERLAATERIGVYFARQKLAGEARRHLMAAAERRLAAREFGKARAAYDTLVQLDPADSGLRIRLAETLALEGKRDEAGYHLLQLGATLQGSPGERERVYRRAAELLPGRPEPLAGLVGALVDAGKRVEAVTVLEEAFARHGALPTLTVELIGLYESSGRRSDALDLLSRLDALETPAASLDRILSPFVARGESEVVWERLRPQMSASITSEHELRKRVAVLDHLADLEPRGHAPALELLADVLEANGDRESAARAVERLVLALRGSGEDAAARALTGRLRGLDPDSKLLGRLGAAGPPSPETPHEAAEAGFDDQAGEVEPPVEAEAPAVPLTRADEEFVSGRVTQAEILEKYGLQEKAVQQLVDIVERFPGHVEAQERLVRIRETEGDGAALRDARVGLALALRAAGRHEDARAVARAAEQAATLPPDVRGTLRRLKLVAPAPVSAPSAPAVERRLRRAHPAEPPQEVVIAFEDEPAPGLAECVEDTPEALAHDPSTDLSDLAAALESELFAEDIEPIHPEAAAEQSLEELFTEFRRRVDAEVGADDFRTRYELGIGYKEMGLVEEAVAEFEVALASPKLATDASAMIALCLRERGRFAEAVEWYRRALGTLSEDLEARRGLEYDLAEALIESGDREQARDVFQSIAGADPEFRDVRERLAEIDGLAAR